MTIEEILRSSPMRTADNGLNYAVVAEAEAAAANGNGHGGERSLERMVNAVPLSLAPRVGRAATYFVPWLVKKGRGVTVAAEAAPESEKRKEMCHHLDVKPQGSILLISLRFYENDSYGLAMEFFDKIAYLASLGDEPRDDFERVLRVQFTPDKAGELTEEAWEWRQGAADHAAQDNYAPESEAWQNYRRAAETDALGLYMAATFTDIFYEDLAEDEPGFPVLRPDLVYERVRAVERLYPANRGYNFQVVRQRPRRRHGAGR